MLDPLDSRGLEIAAEARSRSRPHCRVCAFADVRTDEVHFHEALLLAECPRCEHRWTAFAAPRSVAVRSALCLAPVGGLGAQESAAAA
jgi:hypothetical protein